MFRNYLLSAGIYVIGKRSGRHVYSSLKTGNKSTRTIKYSWILASGAHGNRLLDSWMDHFIWISWAASALGAEQPLIYGIIGSDGRSGCFFWPFCTADVIEKRIRFRSEYETGSDPR